MDADYDDFEIASVIYGFRLVDSESYERTYKSRDGLPLRPGYYIVTWPPAVLTRRFDEHALFRGPFLDRLIAEKIIEKARWRNSREAAAAIESVLEPRASTQDELFAAQTQELAESIVPLTRSVSRGSMVQRRLVALHGANFIKQRGADNSAWGDRQ